MESELARQPTIREWQTDLAASLRQAIECPIGDTKSEIDCVERSSTRSMAGGPSTRA